MLWTTALVGLITTDIKQTQDWCILRQQVERLDNILPTKQTGGTGIGDLPKRCRMVQLLLCDMVSANTNVRLTKRSQDVKCHCDEAACLPGGVPEPDQSS